MNQQTDNSECLLWQGTARLIVGLARCQVNCRIVLRSSSEVDFEMDEFASPELPTAELSVILNGDVVQIEIPGVTEPIEAFRVRIKLNQESVSVTFRAKRTPIWFMKSESLFRGRAEIINFAQYWIGSPVKLGFELKACGWKALFIPVSDETLAVTALMQNETYRISHQVEFERETRSSFTAADAQEFLGNLSLFLSFCHGQWVATAFATAMDSTGEVVLEQWGMGRISSWRDPSGWLDLHHGDAICQLFEKFYRKLKDKGWSDAINHVVYWFTRADTNNTGPDGACILLQAALERFAWHVLVRERSAISEKGFRDLAAADQLRLLLNVLSIPAAIPSGLVQLRAFAKSRGFDGPEAFTFIRNRVVHPAKTSAKPEVLPYYEAYCLAKSYVELAVLSACGYIGEYNSRTSGKRWVGQVEKVPWTLAIESR